MKTLKKILGIIVIMVMVIPTTIFCVYEVALICNLIFGRSVNSDLILVGALVLPLLIYFFWSWNKPEIVQTIRHKFFDD